MIGRPRDISKEVRALELRAAGETQVAVARKLGLSVRSIARYEARWKAGDRPLPEVLCALWSAYDQEVNAWRRVKLLQTLTRASIAHAESQAVLPLVPRQAAAPSAPPEMVWRPGTPPGVVGAAQEMLERARRPGVRGPVDPGASQGPSRGSR